ncbi:MAG TPA: sigma-70 family RNA polymerase sigma factor [Jiangellales bacterium]|nr:sigma-70 family RNA polymerase sigma factor [Jiangellales bacterium]
MGERTTAELVRDAASGDQSAWDELVERYSGLVWAVARGHRMGHADASDVFQTTWLRLVEHLDRLREPEHLGGWLSSTARRECLRVLRLRGRELPDEDVAFGRDTGPRDDPPVPGPEAALLAREERAAVVAAFGHLPDRCQVLLRMLAADPAPSYTEVSTTLDMPVGSIGPTRGRCLEHLRRLLERQHGAPVGPD